MRWRPATVAALVIWGTALALAAAGLWLVFLNRSTWGSPIDLFRELGFAALGGLTYTTVGVFLFARFPKNAMTWALWGRGIILAFWLFASEYVTHAVVVAPGSLPGAPYLLWLSKPAAGLAGGGFFLLLIQLFPDGRPRSRVWRALLYISLGCIAILMVYGLVPTSQDVLLRRLSVSVTWPGFLSGLATIPASTAWPIVQSVAGLAALGLSFCALARLVGLIWRMWHARGLERQQLKWFIYVWVAVFVLAQSLQGGIGSSGLIYPAQGLNLAAVGFVAFLALQGLGIPAATVIAITKYRLYDIDLVVNKALVYGVLALVITAAYAVVVVGIGAIVGGPDRFAFSLVATALIAIGFQPLRTRAQRLANRIVYGKRATPYEALSQLNAQIAGAYGGEEVLNRMTRILAEATGAERAELWVKRGNELVRTSAWPAAPPASRALSDGHLPDIAGDTVLPVTHRSALLGALSITKKRGEVLNPVEEKLVADLASQAGLVLENVGLNRELRARLEELQASQQRLVRAQDEERRRIERNIHDGAQQELVALTVHIGLLERALAKDSDRAKAMATQLREKAIGAVGTLRELAHGIYPSLLVSDGLATALQQQARKSPIAVHVEAPELPRQPKEVEAAIYFCCLEALQNAVKHSGATTVRIKLWTEGDRLYFEVQDDGRGFDVATAPTSSGLQNMRDRMQALGGTLDVRSRPGHGTVIVGSTPQGSGAAVPALETKTIKA